MQSAESESKTIFHWNQRFYGSVCIFDAAAFVFTLYAFNSSQIILIWLALYRLLTKRIKKLLRERTECWYDKTNRSNKIRE